MLPEVGPVAHKELRCETYCGVLITKRFYTAQAVRPRAHLQVLVRVLHRGKQLQQRVSCVGLIWIQYKYQAFGSEHWTIASWSIPRREIGRSENAWVSSEKRRLEVIKQLFLEREHSVCLLFEKAGLLVL